MARRGGGCGSPRMEILSPPRTLRDALPSLPPISTLPSSSSSCTRERLTSSSCWTRKRSRRCPSASWGTLIWRNLGSCNPGSSLAMGDLGTLRAMQPQEATREHHRGGHQLRDRDQTRKRPAAVAAQQGKQEAGEAAQEEPGAEDFSIVMRAIQE